MKNKDFYKAKILECIMNYNCSIAVDKNNGEPVPCDISPACENCKLYSRNMSCTQTWRKWLEQEHKESVLTREEKEYIENIVKPFKHRVKFISKLKTGMGNSYVSICVQMYNDAESVECITLPYFNGNEMYTGMVYFEKYSMRELGLFNDEQAE